MTDPLVTWRLTLGRIPGCPGHRRRHRRAASAYHLARRGASVTLLEQDRLASGATGRNLGFIWVHTRRAGPELELVMSTRNELEGLPEELGADFGLRTNGGLTYFTTDSSPTFHIR